MEHKDLYPQSMSECVQVILGLNRACDHEK